MRLINAVTRQLEEFFGRKVPPYVILSHRWGNEEITFTEYGTPSNKQKAGYKKIEYTCIQAQKDNISYAWIDTCCIDKSSSSELSESINSMYYWYKESSRCYVYLVDVDVHSSQHGIENSEWFFRGWTLQELIAPPKLTFYDETWSNLGDRYQNRVQINDACRLPASLWNSAGSPGDYLSRWSVAQRMSWASNRRTTITEDMAYCLLGLFDINMPLLYGEGFSAFGRLQQEIMKKSSDQTIFAWGFAPVVLERDRKPLNGLELSATISSTKISKPEKLFALPWGPIEYQNCGELVSLIPSNVSYTSTNCGIEIELPVIRDFTIKKTDGQSMKVYVGLLRCEYLQTYELLGILFHPFSEGKPAFRYATSDDWALPSITTIPIDSNQAAQAVPCKVTMALDNDHWDNEIFRGRISQIMKVCFTFSRTLRMMAYSISDVALVGPSDTSLDWIDSDSWPKHPSNLGKEYYHWNSASGTLSTTSESSHFVLFRLKFTSSNPAAPAFYVHIWRLGHWTEDGVQFPFVLGTATITTEILYKGGTVPSDIEQHFHLLESNVVVDFEGTKYEISLNTNVQDVLHHTIFAVQLGASPFSGRI
jgi:hypothetical protein